MSPDKISVDAILKRGIAATVSMLLCTSSFAAVRVVEDSIPVNSDVNFSIDSHRGRVNITTGNVDSIEITAVITHENRDALDRVEINIYRSRERVSVDVEYDYPIFNLGRLFSINSYEFPDIRFDIVLPDEASLTVDSHRSRLDIDAPSGRVRIDTHRGEGRIAGIRNDLYLETHRGNFDLQIVDLHDVRIDTHRGDINLDILQANNFTIDVETNRRSLRVRGRNISVHRNDRDNYIDYSEGDGSNLIRVDAHRGDIDINFLD